MKYNAPAHYSGQADQMYIVLSPLPPYIIEEIRKREERRKEQPRIQPTLPQPMDLPKIDEKEDGKRGVVIIDLSADNLESLI